MVEIASKRKTIIVAICGASGVIYGIRLLKSLLAHPSRIILTISSAGFQVLSHEMGYNGEDIRHFLKAQGIVLHPQTNLDIFEKDNLFAPPASGSFHHDGMAIVPCSMNTLGSIASGLAGDLIRRAADVTLKERRPLILVTRETPLSPVHLKNMHSLALCGATILPASPGFYSSPETILDLVDTVVARIMDQLNLSHNLMTPWGGETHHV
jgi:4-hydroxy-3-polyprenylbenzoate decarboxylase